MHVTGLHPQHPCSAASSLYLFIAARISMCERFFDNHAHPYPDTGAGHGRHNCRRSALGTFLCYFRSAYIHEFFIGRGCRYRRSLITQNPGNQNDSELLVASYHPSDPYNQHVFRLPSVLFWSLATQVCYFQTCGWAAGWRVNHR